MVDTLNIVVPDPVADRTPTVWLIGQALKLLNTAGEAAEVEYSHVIELLRERRDAVSGVCDLLRSTPAEDFSLRWCALFIAGDIGDLQAAEILVRAALQPLPARREENEGCEGPRDGELLVRTMAVEALRRIAARNEEAKKLVLKLINERPELPVLIEAVKAARELKLDDEVQKKLRKKEAWILDIKIYPMENVMADPERRDDMMPCFTPPKVRSPLSGPSTCYCPPGKEG